MFQSRYFERVFPRDNAAFEHVELVDAIPNDRVASLGEYLKLCVWRSAHAVKTGHLLNRSG